MMLGLLKKDGYTFTDDEYDADVIVINTCCFIGDAKEESVNTILEMAQMKEVDVYKRQARMRGSWHFGNG